MKKLLLLGGSRYLLPVIQEAHQLGAYVITCDYLPNNTAHRFADEYHNISILDREAVLDLAKSLQIDGILSFACDPGVATAAYVAEALGLPFQCTYASAAILQDKGKFREFLLQNNFKSPFARSFSAQEDPTPHLSHFKWPVIVKPVDSAGSKGVTRVNSPEELPQAIQIALENGHNDHFIIEEFLTFQGYHSSADDFTIQGNLAFCTYSDQLFDPAAENPYTPAMIIWPSTMDPSAQAELTQETQRLFSLLGMKHGIYNIESCVGHDGTPYLMEVSPRGGGCKIAEIQQLATGVNLIQREVSQALGLPVDPIPPFSFDGVWCEFVIHAAPHQQGLFEKLSIDPTIQEKYVKLIDLAVTPGDFVEPFTGANKALGDLFLRFDSREELDAVMAQASQWLHVILKDA